MKFYMLCVVHVVCCICCVLYMLCLVHDLSYNDYTCRPMGMMECRIGIQKQPFSESIQNDQNLKTNKDTDRYNQLTP